MLELSQLDLDEIATALSDQTDDDHRWLIDPKSGRVAFWTSDTGLDGENPVEAEDVDLTPIDPLPSYVRYQDMTDFADRVGDEAAGCRLARAIAGKGAFRRFKNALYEEFPNYYQPGTFSERPALTGEPLSGSRMKISSQRRMPTSIGRTTPTPTCPNTKSNIAPRPALICRSWRRGCLSVEAASR